jgi:hypothetical protein
MSHYKIHKLQRCAKAKHAWVIEVHAHQLFAVVDDLKAKLGETQYPKVELKDGEKDQRPWYFVFVKDSVYPGYHADDGDIDMRLYVNDDGVAAHFYLLTGKQECATIELY